MQKNRESEVLQSEYRMRFAKLEAYRNAVWKILCQDYFSRHIPTDSTVLDVGAGWGEFINNIEAGRRIAMDLNADTPQRLVDGVEHFLQDCSTPWQQDDGSLDVVFTSNFLEHLRTKEAIEATIEEAFRCLKPGGRILCLGPNIKYVPGEYWDFWDHHIPLTELSIAELLAMKGFEVVENVPRFLPYSMSTGSTPPLFFVRAYLRMPWAWRFFGKQFFVVARK